MIASPAPLQSWIVQVSKPGEIEQCSFTSETEARTFSTKLQHSDLHETTVTITGPDGIAQIVPVTFDPAKAA